MKHETNIFYTVFDRPQEEIATAEYPKVQPQKATAEHLAVDTTWAIFNADGNLVTIATTEYLEDVLKIVDEWESK